MRPCRPDTSGYVVNDGVRVYYETYGQGRPTLLLMPTWAIVHSRFWKMQVPYLARHFRVVTFDPRGNGRTDRPEDPAAYGQEAVAADAVAVLDATETDAAVVLAWCNGTIWSMLLAQAHPDRVHGLVSIATNFPLTPAHPARREYTFGDRLDTEDGWAKENRLLGTGLAGVRGVLHRPDDDGGALDEGLRRRRLMGEGDGRADHADRGRCGHRARRRGLAGAP